MKQTKVVQIGCGKMSKYTMRYVMEKGGKVLAGFDINEKIIGKDIKVVMGGKKDFGVTIYDIANLEKMLKKLKPDVAIVTTVSLFKDCYDVLMTCAKCGVNAITTCEEAFYPANSAKKMTAEIDRVAKENNCTITGSGYQDFSWGSLITNMAGTTHNVKKIVGKSSYNVEDYGIALARAHGAGLTMKEFERDVASADDVTDAVRKKMIDKGEFLPSYMWNVNGWLCEYLGLTVVSQTQKCIPHKAKEDIYSSTLDMTIKKGRATGMSAVVTTTTKEGITLETQCIGKVYSKDEFDSNEWTIEGEPTTTVVVNRPATVEMTCASIVNRIPDLIKAEAGYVPTCRMGDMKYQFKI
ncbi:MAG: dihydrodipicolinate reductase [Clostridiales bacterium]|nr:dihydrodipicolinate reductase [Clostridiales bacterium]